MGLVNTIGYGSVDDVTNETFAYPYPGGQLTDESGGSVGALGYLDPSGGGGGYTAPSAYDLSLLAAQQYDTQRSQFQNQLGTLPAAQQQAETNVNNSYGSSLNGLDISKAQSERNLGLAGSQVQQAKATSLQQIKDQVGGMMDSYMRTPGVSDSSAGMMINRALGQGASRNRHNVLQNATGQQQKIDMQGADMQVQYGQQRGQLDQWKAQTLQQIQMDFLTKKQGLEQQMAGADAQKAMALAQQNAALIDDAKQKLMDLSALYGQQSQQLIQQYQNTVAPQYDLGSYGQYSVQPISAGMLQGLRTAPTGNTGPSPDFAAPMFKKQQEYGY